MSMLISYIHWFNKNKDDIKKQYYSDTSLNNTDINALVQKKAKQMWITMNSNKKNKLIYIPI